MARRRPNPRLAKIHFNYTPGEAARLIGVHKNTVLAWIKSGLPTIDSRRPVLVTGQDLRAYLEAKLKKRKQPCPPGQLYCFGCRKPRPPAGDVADYLPVTATSGNLQAICPTCSSLMHRRVSLAQMEAFRTTLDITIPEALQGLRESPSPSVNCDSSRDAQTDEDSQCRK
jgi:excisionase family DNA binding protein